MKGFAFADVHVEGSEDEDIEEHDEVDVEGDDPMEQNAPPEVCNMHIFCARVRTRVRSHISVHVRDRVRVRVRSRVRVHPSLTTRSFYILANISPKLES